MQIFHPRNGSNCRVHYQLSMLYICSLMMIVSLFLYIMTDIQLKSALSIKNWIIPLHLKQAIDTIQNAIKFPKSSRKKKLILLWTDFDSKKDWLPSTTELDCPVKECFLTSNRSLLKHSSAAILHLRSINLSDLPVCNSTKAINCPLWVLLNREAPPHTDRNTLEAIKDKVHWTVTYRKDSDIFAPYGKVVLKPMRTSLNLDFYPNGQLICWLVSNCKTPSKREMFVQELRNYIDVNTYGACGDMTCPYPLAKDCYEWMSNRCLFYLSLENSNCRDYTTEKLYYALAAGMVPVVISNHSNYEHLPPHSYVNVADFSSPKELAEYLTNAGKNKTKYLSYFGWKRTHEVIDYKYGWYCDLCEKLHTVNVLKLKPHKNLVSWWYNETQCTSWNNS